MGGLATALRLAHRGESVVVLEKTDQVGGRNRHVTVGDCQFDGGPTLLMMLDPFRKLFHDVGERLENHLEITLCDPSYRVFFRSGDRIEGTPNVAKMLGQIEKLCGREEAMRYPRLLGDLGELYRVSIPKFVERNFDSILDFVNPNSLAAVVQHGMLSNLARRMKRYVRDPRLQMLFTFQTMYLGLSPFQAPWVYATLTYMEYGEGIWYPRGGLTRIADVIHKLAMERGAQFRLDSAVQSITGNQVVLDSGETLQAKAVICNADLPYARRELQGKPPKRRWKHSCSAYLEFIDYAGDLPQLEHHNVFFGNNFHANLESIFDRHELPDDPAFYAAVSSKSDPEKAKPGHSNLFLLVPCPNLNRPWSEHDACTLRRTTYERLEYEVGFEEHRIRARKTTDPNSWEQLLNLDKGAAFGLSAHFNQSAFMRPNNIDRKSGVVYVGASTVPGNGLPMVLISADLAVERLERQGIIPAN